MSIPLKVCLITKAAKGDTKAKDKLFEVFKYNKGFGAMTINPCDCEEQCDATDEELQAVIIEMDMRLVVHNNQEASKKGKK